MKLREERKRIEHELRDIERHAAEHTEGGA
jgi:hypothetical protein